MEEYLLLSWHWSDDGPPQEGLDLAETLGMTDQRRIRDDRTRPDFRENDSYILCSRPDEKTLEHYITGYWWNGVKLTSFMDKLPENVQVERICPGVVKYAVEEKPEVLEARRLEAERIERMSEYSDEVRSFEVWVEGYRATGEHARAELWGTASAHSFREAVAIVYAVKGADPSYLDLDRLSSWGCRFFDNEADARKSFG